MVCSIVIVGLRMLGMRDSNAQSRQARYVVTTDLGDETVPVDQTAAATHSLGTFPLASATEYAVRVDDHTGEPGSLEIQLVADALEVRAVSAVEPDGGAMPPDDAGGVPVVDAASAADAGVGAGRGDVGGGCGCSVDARSPRGALALLTLASLALAVRRRR